MLGHRTCENGDRSHYIREQLAGIQPASRPTEGSPPASVHIPRIGAGQAEVNCELIRDIIDGRLVRRRI